MAREELCEVWIARVLTKVTEAGGEKCLPFCCINRQSAFELFSESPNRKACDLFFARQAMRHCASANRERAQQEMQRGADHLIELTSVCDLLAKIGKRAKTVNKFLRGWIH